MIAKIKHYFLIAKPYLMVISGYLFLWVVFGNLLGEIIIRMPYEEGDCYIYSSAWAVFDFECDNKLLKYLSFVFIGLPRLVIVFLYIFLAAFLHGIKNFEINDLLNFKIKNLALVFYLDLFINIAVISLIILPGFYYWRKKIPILAWASMFILSAIIIYTAVRA